MRDIPVTPVDLAPFEAFLRSGRAPAAAMGPSRLDGFLTGVAIGPDPVSPGKWLPAIWGSETPIFADLDEKRAVLGVILNRFREIPSSLRRDPPAFAPFFEKEPGGGRVGDWAAGFFAAIRLRPRAWRPLVRNKDARTLLTPLLISLADGSGKLAAPTELVAKAVGHIPGAVAAIDDFWQDQREQWAAVRSWKIARNARCACGSGRKYKHCCGR